MKKVIIGIFIILISFFCIFNIVNNTKEEKIDFIGDKVEELAMQRVENKIKEQLKNPESFSINNVKKRYTIINNDGKMEFYENQQELKNALEKVNNNKEYTIHYTIDYSAQNGFGGINRDTLTALITLYDKESQITSSIPYIKFNEY